MILTTVRREPSIHRHRQSVQYNTKKRLSDDDTALLHRVLEVAGIAAEPMDPISLQALRDILLRQHDEPRSSVASVATHKTSDNNKQQQQPQQQLPDEIILHLLHTILESQRDTQRDIQALHQKVKRLEDALVGEEDYDDSSRKATTATTAAATATTSTSTSTAATVTGPPPAPQPPQSYFVVRLVRTFYQRSIVFGVRPLEGGLVLKLVFMMAVLSARVSRRASSSKNNHHHDSSSSSQDYYRLPLLLLVMVIGFLWHVKYIQYLYHFFITENIPYKLWKGQDYDLEQQDDSAGAAPEAENHPHRRRPENDPADAGAHAGANADGGDGDGQAPPHDNDNDDDNDDDDNNNNEAAAAAIPNGRVAVRVFLRRPVGAAAAAAAAPNHPWIPAFLGGEIPARNNDNDNNNNNNHRNVLLGILADILCILGSFVMSVFPMWQPAAPPPPPQTDENNHRLPPEQEDDDEEGQDDDDENSNNNNNNNDDDQSTTASDDEERS